LQVKHELRAFIAKENVRELCAEAEAMPLSAPWKDIEDRRRGVVLLARCDMKKMNWFAFAIAGIFIALVWIHT
jgi:hypothetical protein